MNNPMNILNRRLVISAMALAVGGTAFAQDAFPGRPIKLVVGFAPGTGPDMLARVLANQLAQQWPGASVLVQNTSGAGGMIAAQEVARANPDGYTLFLGAAGQLSIAPNTHTKLTFDPAKDFAPISLVADNDFVLLVNPKKVPARNLNEFIEWSRKQPGIFMATFGAGTAGHFGAYILGDEIKVKPDVVHYRNTGDALSGLYGGDVQGVFASIALAAPQVDGGKLVALANTGRKRSDKLPSVPTFSEVGHPAITFTSWFGVVAPAKTPPALLAQLQVAVQKATSAAEASIVQAGFSPVGSTSVEFAKTIRTDTELWGKAVRSTGFKAD